MPHRVLCTHIGQHILRGHHIEGQAAQSRANICGCCGAWDECTIHLPLQSWSTRGGRLLPILAIGNLLEPNVSGNQGQPLHQPSSKLPPLHNHGLVV